MGIKVAGGREADYTAPVRTDGAERKNASSKRELDATHNEGNVIFISLSGFINKKKGDTMLHCNIRLSWSRIVICDHFAAASSI